MFFVERDAPTLDGRLGFVVLNTKDIFSWIQIFHQDDVIEFSPEMAIIVPSSRQDVMWPGISMKASDGLYASFIVRLLARCHLLLKYGLEWPDRWKAGQAKFPESHVPDPQSASHEPSNGVPNRESDLLAMLRLGSQVTEIERVAEEIVRVVAAGGTWCRNEYAPPESGWPADWEEPKGTAKEIWGPVAANPIPGETTATRETLTSVYTSSSISDASGIKVPAPPASAPPPKQSTPITNGKKKPSTPQPPAGLVLTNDVLSNLLNAPLKTSLAPPRQDIDDHKTPVPSDFNAILPDTTSSQKPLSTPGKSRRAKAKAKRLASESATASAAESEMSVVESDEHDNDVSTAVSQVSTGSSILRIGTPAFGIIDDRLSDDEDQALPNTNPTANAATTSVSPTTPAITREGSTTKEGKKKGKKKAQQPHNTQVNQTPSQSSANQDAPIPGILKFHQKGYIPQNSDKSSSLDTSVMKEVLVSAMVKENGNSALPSERNNWIRELLQLIHTNKEFVDNIYNDYKTRIS
ncbi:hypothetical protein CPB86DRAFT_782374 [Serendipita vermifera]|nr:hypothetical protein CPB86DRAFT_782374 [Serendipita vermifera]